MKKFDELQLRFESEDFADLDENEEEDRSVSPERARQISEAARIILEDRTGFETGRPEWMNEYLRLRENGWPWRVAAYIAWASSPRDRRWPDTLKALASEVLGLKSPRAIYNWRRKYPAIDATIAMLQAAPLWEHRRDVIEALVEVATTPDYKTFNDRKLFLEMVGDYTPKSKLELGKAGKGDDMAEMDDEDLRRWLGADGENEEIGASHLEDEDGNGDDHA